MTYALETTNYSGHVFSDFYVRRDPGYGPGWFVFGRNSEKYGTIADGSGAYVKRCAWPDRPPRRHVHYNGQVQHGWRLKRDAQAVADRLNNPA
jgi:hypothetical protein